MLTFCFIYDFMTVSTEMLEGFINVKSSFARCNVSDDTTSLRNRIRFLSEGRLVLVALSLYRSKKR